MTSDISTSRGPGRKIMWYLVAAVLFLATWNQASAALSPDVNFGGYFDDGASHTVPPNLVAHDPVLAQNTTQVGAFLSSTSRLSVAGNGSISVNEHTGGEAYGVYATEHSSIAISPLGRITVNDTSNGAAVGLYGEGQARFSAEGVIDINEEGNHNAVISHLTDAATLLFGGSATATEMGDGNVIGILGAASSRSDFFGNFQLTELGNGDALPFHLQDNASLVYRGQMLINESGNASRAGALVEDNAVAELSGGSITIRSDGLSGLAQLVLLEVTDSALVSISGGSYSVFENGVGILPRVVVNGMGELRLRGSHFNRPLGAIGDAAGSITGRFADGRQFNWQFERASGASIVLVPEPAALSAAWFLAALASTRRRRS